MSDLENITNPSRRKEIVYFRKCNARLLPSLLVLVGAGMLTRVILGTFLDGYKSDWEEALFWITTGVFALFSGLLFLGLKSVVVIHPIKRHLIEKVNFIGVPILRREFSFDDFSGIKILSYGFESSDDKGYHVGLSPLRRRVVWVGSFITLGPGLPDEARSLIAELDAATGLPQENLADIQARS